jgi:hypothetical protein
MSDGSEFFYDATTGASYSRFYEAGRLVEEHAMRVHRVNGRLAYQLREIDHVHRTYTTPSGTTEIFTPTDHSAELRAFVRSGVLRIAGRTRFAGHDALILTNRRSDCLKCMRWVVDAATYQQLRLTTSVPRLHKSLTVDYDEVPRTDEALAAMWPAIPAGYRRVDSRFDRGAHETRKARHGKRAHRARHGKRRHRAARV